MKREVSNCPQQGPNNETLRTKSGCKSCLASKSCSGRRQGRSARGGCNRRQGCMVRGGCNRKRSVWIFSGGIFVNSNSIVRTLTILQAGTPSESAPAPGAACPRPLSIETFVSASPQHARFAPSATQTSIVLRLAQRRSASCSHLPSIESSDIYSLKAPQHARFAPSAAQISIVVASPVNVNQGPRDFFAAKARAFCA